MFSQLKTLRLKISCQESSLKVSKQKLSHRKSESVRNQLPYNLWVLKDKPHRQILFSQNFLFGWRNIVCAVSAPFITFTLINFAKWLRLSLAGWKIEKRWSRMQEHIQFANPFFSGFLHDKWLMQKAKIISFTPRYNSILKYLFQFELWLLVTHCMTGYPLKSLLLFPFLV